MRSGHHVLKHNFGETNCDERKKMEREADEYSGKALRRLCSSREQSLAALKSLPQNQMPGRCYPPIRVRIKDVGEAWSNQDSIFKAHPNQDPCIEKVTNLQLVYPVSESIKSTNPRANIYNDRVEFMLDIPFAKKRNKVFTHIVLDEKAGELMRIKSFKWKDFPFNPGSKKLIWYYKKDSLTRKQVENMSYLNVCSFDKNPAPTSNGELLEWGAVTAAGAGLITWSGLTFSESQGLYNTYKLYKNPQAEQYLPPNQLQPFGHKKQGGFQVYAISICWGCWQFSALFRR